MLKAYNNQKGGIYKNITMSVKSADILILILVFLLVVTLIIALI